MENQPLVGEQHHHHHHDHDWHEGLCGCFDDCLSCCLACFLPCVQFGMNAGRLHEVQGHHDGTSQAVLCGLLYFLAGCVGVPCIVGALLRAKIRQTADIHGGFCGDCCVHCWCWCCAIAQEHRELQHRWPENHRAAPPQVTVVYAAPPGAQVVYAAPPGAPASYATAPPPGPPVSYAAPPPATQVAYAAPPAGEAQGFYTAKEFN